MNNLLNIGDLYSSDCHLLVYSSTDFNTYNSKSTINMEDVGKNFGDAYFDKDDAIKAATFFEKRLGQKTWFVEPGTWFMILDKQTVQRKEYTSRHDVELTYSLHCFKVLHDTRTGWIVWNQWAGIRNLKEVKNGSE